MNAMNYGIWLAGFTVLSIISKQRISPLSFSEYSNLCYIDYSVGGLQTINCSTLYPNLTLHVITLPILEDKATLEVIYIAPIEPHEKIAVDIMGIDYLSYPNLKRIIIRNNEIIKRSLERQDFKGSYTLYYRHVLERVFSDCNSLEILEISNSDFHDLIQFKLPKKLKTYIVERNKYTVMKIYGSEELVELNANDNPLKNVPLISKENPPLETLRLKRCPLQDMTIIDIAPLCELSLLELEFSRDNRMVNSEGYCNCTILKEWAEEVQLKVDRVECYGLKSTEKISCPHSQYLNDAREIRRKRCPFLKKGAVRKMIISVLLYIFFSVLFFLMLATLILFIIRHYHLREWWRQYHQSNAATMATSITIEEEEETPETPITRRESLEEIEE